MNSQCRVFPQSCCIGERLFSQNATEAVMSRGRFSPLTAHISVADRSYRYRVTYHSAVLGAPMTESSVDSRAARAVTMFKKHFSDSQNPWVLALAIVDTVREPLVVLD